MNSEQILAMIKSILVAEFEIEEQAITPDANIYEDLDIDSIDVVDLVVRLKSETGKAINPENFKQVRTIGDLVNAIDQVVNN